MSTELPHDRRADLTRWVMLGALIPPLPLLEVRAPLIGAELHESLRLILVLMAASVGVGVLAARSLRSAGRLVEPVAAAVAGLAWLSTVVTDNRGVLYGAIVIGLAGGWTAVLTAIDAGVSGRAVLAAGVPIVVVALVPLAIHPAWKWHPFAALCGLIALVAAVVSLRAGWYDDPARRSRHSMPLLHTIRVGGLVSVVAGVTWGTTPAVNRVTWQQFRAVERYSFITVLGGALFAGLLVGAAVRRVARHGAAGSHPLLRRESTGGFIAIALYVISLAPTLAVTMLARALALGGADLLMADPGELDHPEVLASRWRAAAMGIVVGLTITGFVTVTEAIDPRTVVALLASAVVLATVADLALARSSRPADPSPSGLAAPSERGGAR